MSPSTERLGRPTPGRPASELATRAALMIVALPVLGVLIAWGPPWAYGSVLVGFVTLAAWELSRMLDGRSEPRPSRVWMPPIVLVLGTMVALRVPLTIWVVEAVALFVMLRLATPLLRRDPVGTSAPTGGLAIAYLGVLPIPLLLLHVVAGATWTLLALVSTWGYDVFAYLIGGRFGGPPLAPAVNPRKTLGGFVVATLGTTVVVAGLLAALGAEGVVIAALVVAIPASVLNQLGDLAESLIKRRSGLEHSSRIVHGHGGALDVLDGLLFAGPYLLAASRWFTLA